MYLLMKKVNIEILTEAAAGRRPTSGRAPCLHIIRRLAGFQPAWAGLCPASGLSGRKRRITWRHGLLTPLGVKRPPLNTLALYCFNRVT